MKQQTEYRDTLIQQAVEIIENGGVVILPADTIYGIYGNALSEESIERVYRIKGRKRSKPFGIVSTKSKIADIVQLNPLSVELVDRCWPAPISLIAPKNNEIIPFFFSGAEAGLLVVSASNEVLTGIVERCQVPIFSTTCNLAGEDEARTVEDLERFRPLVDLVIENDFFEFAGTPSTIVNTMGDQPIVIREGAYPVEQIMARIDGIKVDCNSLIQ